MKSFTDEVASHASAVKHNVIETSAIKPRVPIFHITSSVMIAHARIHLLW